MKEKLNKYAIRKLSIGVASVLIGASFFVIANAKIVKADTLNNSAIIQTSKASAAQDTNVPKAKDASVQISNPHTKEELTKTEAQSSAPQTKEELTKTDAQSSAPQTKDIYIYLQSSASQGTQKNGLEADSKQSNTITPETQESTQTDQTKAVQSQTLDNRQAPNINASDWTGEVVSNTDIDGVTRKYYKLTKYMGSDLDIVVPDNDALTQAGTYEVGVTSDFIKDLAKTANSITFLGKNNIKALNNDWNSTFDQAGIKTFNGAGLDTSNITNTAWLFNNNQNLTSVSGVSDWDTSHITNMNGMFSGDTNLSIIDDLSNWNVSNCTNVHTMFFGDANLTNIGDLSNWDTENIQDSSQMFFKTAKLTSIGDLSKWALENDKDLSQMFFGNAGLTNIGDLSNWNTKNVQNMFQLFFGCSGLRDIGKLDNWQTGNTTNMSQMFFGVNSLSSIGDLSKWDTMRVQNMSQMFFGASGLSNLGNLDNWDVSSVQDMSQMFFGANKLTNIGDLSNWDTSQVQNMSGMFFGASKLINIGNLNNWNVSNVQDLSQMFFRDSSLANIGDLSTWKTGKVTNLSQMFFGTNKLTNIGDLSNWDTSQVQNMSGMFFGASGLTSVGKLNNWNTSKVTNLSKMFEGASKLVDLGDLSNWDTSIVTNMSEMFFNAEALTNIGKLDKWDTSNTTNMAQMFFGAGNLKNLGLANWDTDQVTDMHGMFEGAGKLTNIGNLSNWKTDKVQNMDTMFNNASSLSNLNISGWVIPDNNSAMLSNLHHLILVANGTTVVPNKTMFNYSSDLIVLTNNANLLKLNTPTNSLYINGDPYTTRSSFYNSNGSSDAITVLKQANNIFAKDYVAKNAGVKSLDYDANLNQTDPFALANAKFVRTDQTQVIPSYSTAKRTITIYNPDGTKLIYVQTIGYVKRDVKDMFTGIVTQDTWNLDDQTSSFTINNIKQVGKSYVDKNNKIYFAKITIPKINGYKAYIVPNKSNPALFTVSFMAVPTETKPSNPIEETPSKPSALADNPNKPAGDLQQRVVTELNSNDSGRTMPENNSTYTVEIPADDAIIDLSNLVIAKPIHVQTRTQIRVNKRFKLSKKHSIKHLKHRKKAVRQFKKYRL